MVPWPVFIPNHGFYLITSLTTVSTASYSFLILNILRITINNRFLMHFHDSCADHLHEDASLRLDSFLRMIVPKH